MTNLDKKIIQALRAATRVVAFTGAGVSAESGIPTFRDKQTGLWEKFDAAELATPDAFERDAPLVWGWYEWRRAFVRNAEPNAGHRAIAAMETQVPQFALVTQNVDDLHERAGSTEVIHLHGELSKPFCGACRQPHIQTQVLPDFPKGGERINPPRCGSCGAGIRPGVVWFGERLPEIPWAAAREAAKQCEVFLCCGTSALVQPAASLLNIAIDAGDTTVQINPNPTGLDASVTVAIRGPSGTVLPQIVSETWGLL